MTTRKLFGAAGLALVAGMLSVAPVACGGGGGGGIGIGIATVGVSAILAGSSPGWRIVDPALAAASQAAAGGGTVTLAASPENPLTLQPGESVDRVGIAGGAVSPKIVVAGFATATAATQLKGEFLFSQWDGSFNQAGFATGTAAIAASTTGAPFTLTIDFTTVSIQNQSFTDIVNNPGDYLTIRLTNTGASALTIDPTRTTISLTSAQVRESRMRLRSQGGTSFGVEEDISARLLSTAGAAVRIDSLGSNVTITAGVNQTAIFRAQVTDANDTAVAGQRVTFTASTANAPSSTTVITGADGIASATFSFPAAATATTNQVVASIPLDTTAFFVTVVNSAIRTFDSLDRFVTQTDGVAASANISVNVGGICVPTPTGGFVGAGKSTLPSGIELNFPGNTTSGAQWKFDVFARTRSQSGAATARFTITVLDQSNTVLATSTQQTVGAGLQHVSGTLTQSAAFPTAPGFSPSLTAGNQAIMKVQIASQSSSDSSTPGVEIITDDAAPSRIYLPGPVFFATNGSGQKFLVSSPDPRK